MSRSERIELAGLAVACAGISITVAAIRPDWAGAVTWLIVLFFLALAVICAAMLGRDMNRKRRIPRRQSGELRATPAVPPQPTPALPPVPYTGPVGIKSVGGHGNTFIGNKAYGMPVLSLEDEKDSHVEANESYELPPNVPPEEPSDPNE